MNFRRAQTNDRDRRDFYINLDTVRTIEQGRGCVIMRFLNGDAVEIPISFEEVEEYLQGKL